MNIKDLKDKNTEELNSLLADLKVKAGELRFKLANRQLKNFKEIKEVKKNIARIKTIIKETKNGTKSK